MDGSLTYLQNLIKQKTDQLRKDNADEQKLKNGLLEAAKKGGESIRQVLKELAGLANLLQELDCKSLRIGEVKNFAEVIAFCKISLSDLGVVCFVFVYEGADERRLYIDDVIGIGPTEENIPFLEALAIYQNEKYLCVALERAVRRI